MRTTISASRLRARLAGLAVAAALCVTAPTSALGQASDDDGIRIGVAFGGISTFGILVEFYDGNRSLDLTLGTWSFRDVGISAVAKRYIGDNALRPYVGAGLWLAIAAPAMDGERTGFALVARAPVGLDWQLLDDHAAGLAVNLNRALAVRRSDPEDDLPPNGRIVPLPGLYYRYTAR